MGLALALAGAGQATEEEGPDPGEISYTYVSLEYELSNTHHGSEGLTLGFSFEFADPFHVFGGYQLTSIELDDVAPGVEGEREGYLLGGGIKRRIGEGMTAQFRVGYLHSATDIKFPGLGTVHTDKGNGHYVAAGVRTLPWPKWEIDGFFANFSLGGYHNNMVFITLESRATKNIGLNLSYKKTKGDNASDSWTFGLRYHL